MLEKIFEDINKALDAGAYIAALALALTLPDLCSQIEFPDEELVWKRYTKWYDKYMGTPTREFMTEKLTDDDNERTMPWLTGIVIYKLRCNLFHSSNPNVMKKEIYNENKEPDEIWNVDHFVLVIESKKEGDCYVHSSSVQWGGNLSDDIRTYKLSIRKLCTDLIYVTKVYLLKHPDQKPKIQFEILDLDKLNCDLKSQ